MPKTLSNIQFRIDSKDKKKLAKVLDDVGLDIPTAFRMFAKRVINHKGVPWRAEKEKLTVNGLTEKEEREILEDMKHPERFIGPFDNAKDLIKSLRS